MTLKELIEYGNNILKDNKIDIKQNKYLIEDLFNTDDRLLTDDEINIYKNSINRLINREPLSYITNKAYFYGNEFYVNKNTLIPRFETEELVFNTINYINEYFDKEVDILEIGTGSGCISITLKKELPNSNITSTDISLEALTVAKKNGDLLNTNINFIHSDLFNNINNKYDVIISNPPYISYDEKVEDKVYLYEPHLALYADNNGLYYYTEILKNSINYINNKGLIAFEIGHKQMHEIEKLVNKYYPNSTIIKKKDIQKRDRMIFIFIDN